MLYQQLKTVDPAICERLHPNDPQRIMRALEVYEITGEPMSRLQASNGKQQLPYQLSKYVIAPNDRSLLHERIASRFNSMIEQGFEEEVRNLMTINGMHENLPSMRSVGYRQMLMYLRGDYSREEMIERGVIATRQLAKRQFTWLRADPEYTWLGDDPVSQIFQNLSRNE